MSITNFKFTSCLILAITLLAFSCGKDDDMTVDPTNPTTPTTPTTPASMTALVDGSEWTMGSFGATATLHNDYITIWSNSTENVEMQMTLHGTSDGTYSLDPQTGSHIFMREAASSLYDSKLNEANTNFGSVNITEMDLDNQTMSGTFESVVTFYFNEFSTGSSTISEGQFTNIELIDERDPMAESLSFEIDGRPLNSIWMSASISQGNIIINGEDAPEREGVQLTLPIDATPGTYNIGDAYKAEYDPLFQVSSNTANSGNITITEHDLANQLIIGTFSFETDNLDGDGIFDIQSGSFRVNYE